MQLREYITAIVYPGEQSGYVAECQEISVVTQAESLDEIAQNLREAVALHLDGENLAEFGLDEHFSILTNQVGTIAK
ncbi:MAG: type II toxin-antitoxin system HicB family antitoxin [Leptolyngbyaceae cyanobacterium RU_5_1]|nr:type II toxin-antitoxin system HicB family antitoxin [Leptolyngbyaceae cyanobacterium RU_5_1]